MEKTIVIHTHILTYLLKRVFPMVPGHEPIGIVSKIGEKVSKFKIGDVVVAAPIKGCC